MDLSRMTNPADGSPGSGEAASGRDGNGREGNDREVSELASANPAPVIAALLKKRGVMELTSFGMSMYPLIREGDISRFVRVNAESLAVGDICLFVSGSVVLTGHRLVEIQGGDGDRQYVFCGDTSYAPDDPVGPESILGLWTGVKRGRMAARAGRTRSSRDALAAEKGGRINGRKTVAAASGRTSFERRGSNREKAEDETVTGDGLERSEHGSQRNEWLTPRHMQARLLRFLILRFPIARKFTRRLGVWSMARKSIYRTGLK
ncbi:hypothetical protein M3223_17415 [Paenibacillus pasadenensis]|uniref:hypothetical protein n=1 Tax=Paenibacillus pasadenensis TaxID=217090 RepID=UPI00203F0F82|nr:hypothetical protein [Paenibacillus pasadenensis]MCM3749139.1 hypothetical protein [Paenibacillus pasadenensis]